MIVPEIVDPNGGEAFYKAFRKREVRRGVTGELFSKSSWKPMGLQEKAQRVFVPER